MRNKETEELKGKIVELLMPMHPEAAELKAEEIVSLCEQVYVGHSADETIVFCGDRITSKTELKAESPVFWLGTVIGSLPSLEEAAKVAVRISEEAINPPLEAKEQAMFIAGFQECIKWLNIVFSNDR